MWFVAQRWAGRDFLSYWVDGGQHWKLTSVNAAGCVCTGTDSVLEFQGREKTSTRPRPLVHSASRRSPVWVTAPRGCHSGRLVTIADILKKEIVSSKWQQEAQLARNRDSERMEEAGYSCGRGRSGFGYYYWRPNSGWVCLLKSKFNFTDGKKHKC